MALPGIAGSPARGHLGRAPGKAWQHLANLTVSKRFFSKMGRENRSRSLPILRQRDDELGAVAFLGLEPKLAAVADDDVVAD